MNKSSHLSIKGKEDKSGTGNRNPKDGIQFHGLLCRTRTMVFNFMVYFAKVRTVSKCLGVKKHWQLKKSMENSLTSICKHALMGKKKRPLSCLVPNS